MWGGRDGGRAALSGLLGRYCPSRGSSAAHAHCGLLRLLPGAAAMRKQPDLSVSNCCVNDSEWTHKRVC